MDYYNQSKNTVDIVVEQYLIDNSENRSIETDLIDTTRCAIIENIESILKEQLNTIDQFGFPNLKYCYLFQKIQTNYLELKLAISNLNMQTYDLENIGQVKFSYIYTSSRLSCSNEIVVTCILE
jgi:hypothetical protein